MKIESIINENLGKGLFRVGLAALAITTAVYMGPELTDKNQKLVDESEFKKYSEVHRKEMVDDINLAGNLLGYAMTLGMMAAGGLSAYSSIKYFGEYREDIIRKRERKK